MARSLIVDAADFDDPGIIEELNTLINAQGDWSQIVFLGRSAYKSLVRHLDINLPSKIIEPDWESRFSLYQIYRSAAHVIFVDTMRVMDAAFTNCSCSLVVSKKFTVENSTDHLFRSLEQAPDCTLVNRPDAELCIPVNGLLSVNDLSDLTRTITLAENYENPSHEPDTDWFDGLLYSEAVPVVSDITTVEKRSVFFNRKKKLQRKLVKLRDDPGAFFRDSKIGVLQKVGHMFYRAPKAG